MVELGFPQLENLLPDVLAFGRELAQAHQAGQINSWENLSNRVHHFFTNERLDKTTRVVANWRKMAAFQDGVTLTHVMCVLASLFLSDMYPTLTPQQKAIMRWTVMYHDVAKRVERKGHRDLIHGFRSAVITAHALPRLGFAVSPTYHAQIIAWSDLTYGATSRSDAGPIQDNTKLPQIIAGIESLFGLDTPSALVVKTVLLHMSVNVVSDWPQAAPLTLDECKRYITEPLHPLLKLMMLVDNDGWTWFEPAVQLQQRRETRAVFDALRKFR